MRSIEEILADAIGRPEMLKTGRAQLALRQWSQVVGPMLASKCQPDRYEKGVIWVVAAEAAWAQEIHFQKAIILSRLNEVAGENLFLDLRAGARPPRPSSAPRD